ncbi:hypothetical protein NIES4103_11760 [Nostoc sp. NIES-4103]|nr:hypothetical protein NIES4103_11760 [Nostoc sp. NIES-4103]
MDCRLTFEQVSHHPNNSILFSGNWELGTRTERSRSIGNWELDFTI